MVIGCLDGRGAVVAGRVGGIRQGRLLQRRAHHHAAFAVYASGLDAGVERDAVVAIPRERIHEDVRGGLSAVEHIAQENAVVIAVRLGPEHHDVETIRRPLQDFLDDPGSGHAVAYDHEFLSARSGHHTVRLLPGRCSNDSGRPPLGACSHFSDTLLARTSMCSTQATLAMPLPTTTHWFMRLSVPRARRTACNWAHATWGRRRSASPDWR